MPREIVRNDHTSGPFVAKVGWSSDTDVQLGIEGDEGRSLNWLLYESDVQAIGEKVWLLAHETDGLTKVESYERIGRAVLDIFDSVPGGKYQGIWVILDRAGCNRLIRILRRARDAAFGADA